MSGYTPGATLDTLVRYYFIELSGPGLDGTLSITLTKRVGGYSSVSFRGATADSVLRDAYEHFLIDRPTAP